MKPRGFALLGLLPYIIGGIAIASLAGWLWWRADHWCNSACRVSTDRAVAAEKLLNDAKERATALALMWADAIQRVEVHYVEVVRERETKFAGIRERAGRIKPATDAVVVRIPADAVSLLADGANAANAAAAAQGDSGAAQAVPAAAGDQETTLTQWTEFAREAGEAYADVYERFVLARDAAKACHKAMLEATK